MLGGSVFAENTVFLKIGEKRESVCPARRRIQRDAQRIADADNPFRRRQTALQLVRPFDEAAQAFGVSVVYVCVCSVKRSQYQVRRACRAEHSHCVPRVFREAFRRDLRNVQICAAGEYGKGLVRTVAAHVSAEIERMERFGQESEICAVRVIDEKHHAVFMRTFGQRAYVGRRPEVVGACYKHCGGALSRFAE